MIIGICDDVLEEALKTKAVLCTYKNSWIADSEIRIYNPAEVSQDIETDSVDFDILLLDICFDGYDYNGITLAHMINRKLPHCQIIYLTKCLTYVRDIYETEHCYFVLKEDAKKKLYPAMEKAKKLRKTILHESQNDTLEIISGGHKTFINQKDILYVEREQRHTNIYTIKQHYLCYQSLTALQKELSESLVRCHGGYIVNLQYITYLGRKHLKISGKIDIPIGVTYKSHIREKYQEYWKDQMNY